MPTLGPKVYRYDLFRAVWSLRVQDDFKSKGRRPVPFQARAYLRLMSSGWGSPGPVSLTCLYLQLPKPSFCRLRVNHVQASKWEPTQMVVSITSNPRAPSMWIIPILGPKVYTSDPIWAIWSPRKQTSNDIGSLAP